MGTKQVFVMLAGLVGALTVCGCPPPGTGPAATTGADRVDDVGKPHNGLRLRLTAGKTVYQEGEPLEFTATLENVSRRKLWVLNRATHVDLTINAVDARGKYITSVLPPAPPPPPEASDIVMLGPEQAVRLHHWELLDRVNRQIKLGTGRTGEFSVTASYRAGEGTTSLIVDIEPRSWTGLIHSNAVKIVVK